MEYQELLNKLYQVNLFGGMKLGLENMLRLNPNGCRGLIVHIAGTNGKGSVACKIAKGLELEGKQVGLYTSPHIASFRERIRVNGEMISEEAVCLLLHEIFDEVERKDIPATFFEITTTLAFRYFEQCKVEYAVIETGLGGRLDATNIVKPELCVITSIGWDHMDVLGDTLEKIAKEKCGICKENTPVILGPHASICKKFVDGKIVEGVFKSFEEENRATAKEALKLLGIENEQGLEAKMPCRMERVGHVIFDVAHNLEGLEALEKELKEQSPLRVILGFSKGKDALACLKVVKRFASEIYLVEAPNGRGISVKELKKLALKAGIEENRLVSKSFLQDRSKTILVCGSFFIMSAIRSEFGIYDKTDPVDMNEKNAGSNNPQRVKIKL